MSCVPSQCINMPRVSKLGRKVVMPLMCLHFKGRFEKIESLNLTGAMEAKRTSFILIWRSERLLDLRLQWGGGCQHWWWHRQSRIWGQEGLQWGHGQVWPEHQLFEGSWEIRIETKGMLWRVLNARPENSRYLVAGPALRDQGKAADSKVGW